MKASNGSKADSLWISQHIVVQFLCFYPFVSTSKVSNICDQSKTIERFGLEGVLNLSWSQPSWHGQGFVPLVQVAQRPVQPCLKHFQEWGGVQAPRSVVFAQMLQNGIQRNSCWETKEEKKRLIQTDQGKTKDSNFWKNLASGKIFS